MTDITPLFNQLLASHDAPATANPTLSRNNTDSFLREAYEINAGIASLDTELRGIRQSYLSTAAPSRRALASSKDKQWKHLTDRQRDEIDAETKKLLRDLNSHIRILAEAESVRQSTEETVRKKQYARRGLGSLGKWAAGGVGQSKTLEEQLDEAKANAISMHRENVLWYLRQKLQQCGTFQASMMEKRIMREMEKNKSTLAKARLDNIPKFSFDTTTPTSSKATAAAARAHTEAQELYPEEELTEQQIQVFEKQNLDMLKHYESTLDQVRTAEKSLIEISELQTQLVNNLATQSAHIEQLVTDSYLTTDNVGGGNKQLKKATEKKSTARIVFYTSCGLSLFLVIWDLLI